MLVKSQVKYIQSLGHKKFRDADGVFVAEGPKIVQNSCRQTIFIWFSVLLLKVGCSSAGRFKKGQGTSFRQK